MNLVYRKKIGIISIILILSMITLSLVNLYKTVGQEVLSISVNSGYENILSNSIIEQYSDYLSDIKVQATGWYSSNNAIHLDQDSDLNKFKLVNDGSRKEYDKGILIEGNGLITYTNLLDYGYETFSGYIGFNYIEDYNLGSSVNYIVEFLIDGEVILITDKIYYGNESEYIEIDVSEARVFQIRITSTGTVLQEHAVIGDAMFTKSSAMPYLYAFDLEFNQSDQVTESNILDYIVAKDYLGNDISDKISYTTNFRTGDIGTFDITYTVEDNYGNKRSRDAKIIITGEDYSKNLSIERMQQPWADYMYHPRQTMDYQNQLAFDYILESVLDFDIEDGVYVTNKPNLAYKLTINLLDNGIYVNANYIKNMTEILYDSEPRVYLIRKWTQEYSMKNGLVDTVTFYMTYAYLNEEDEYDNTTQLILDNGNTFLSLAKDDMTYQQKFYYTVNAYAKWITYSDGGELIHSLGYGYGKCGGNAMGVVHLAHRLNIKSNYGDGNVGTSGFHGWSYQKMPDEDGWYFTDTLWGRMLNTPNDDTYAPYYGSGAYTWFDENESTYSADKKKYTYPSVWIELKSDVIHLSKGEEYNFLDNISTVDSIYDDNITLEDLKIEIRYASLEDSPYISMGNCLDDILLAGDNLLSGEYIVSYIADYNGFYIVEESTLIVTDESIEDYEYSALTGTYRDDPTIEGVYDGTNEIYGKGFSLNNSSYVILNIENKNYQTLNFMYSARAYVRTYSYAISYAKMYLNVYFDDILAYTSNTKTAYSIYDSPTLIIPEGTKKIKIENVALGQASHGAVINVNYGYSEELGNEYPQIGDTTWVTTIEPTYEKEGEKQLVGTCGCVLEIEAIDKLVIDIPTQDEDEVIPNTEDDSNEENETNKDEVLPDNEEDNSNEENKDEVLPDNEEDNSNEENETNKDELFPDNEEDELVEEEIKFSITVVVPSINNTVEKDEENESYKEEKEEELETFEDKNETISDDKDSIVDSKNEEMEDSSKNYINLFIPIIVLIFIILSIYKQKKEKKFI